MRVKTTYIADDGKAFRYEADCLAYESDLTDREAMYGEIRDLYEDRNMSSITLDQAFKKRVKLQKILKKYEKV